MKQAMNPGPEVVRRPDSGGVRDPASAEAVGDWIRRRRTELGLSQAQVAARIGMHSTGGQSFVSNWERGARTVGMYLEKLESVLGPFVGKPEPVKPPGVAWTPVAKPEPVKPEPAKLEPVKLEPVKLEPAPVKVAPVKAAAAPPKPVETWNQIADALDRQQGRNTAGAIARATPVVVAPPARQPDQARPSPSRPPAAKDVDDAGKGYTWLTELPFGRPGRRIVKRHSDGRCAVVHHDAEAHTIRGVLGFASPPGHDAFSKVVDRWISEEIAVRLIGANPGAAYLER